MANQQSPERVTSDPVPVPTPTDDVDRERDPAEDVTDRVPEDTLDDRGTFEDPALAGERNDPDDLTAVSPEYHEPEPQRTAFGAATVGGAAAAAAQAGPSHEVRDRDDAAEAEDAVGDPVPDTGTAEEVDEHADRNGHDVRDDLDLDLDRTTALDADRDAEERAYADSAEQAEPVVDAEDEPAAAVDTPAASGAAAAVEEPIAGLWGEGTAQGYRDRWREVQLRFIDDPATAAREANLLVEEAVGALTAELSRQKEELSGWSGEDTEQLRSVVRRHRDFLDRLLGL